MSEYLVVLIAMFLVALVISATSGADTKGESANSYVVSREKVRICGKVAEFSQKDGKPVHTYIIVGLPKQKNDRFGKPKEFEVSRIDYAQMHENTEVELLFDSSGVYETFRLIKANVPAAR